MSSSLKAIFAWQSWFFGLMPIIKLRRYSVLLQSSFTLLSRNLRTDIHLETAWQKMGTANIAVLHWRHIRSSDPLHPYFPSLLVRWELVVAYVCCFTSFCWIIRTSRDTTVHHFLETLTYEASEAFSDILMNTMRTQGRERARERVSKIPRKIPLTFLRHITLLTNVTRLVFFQDGGTLLAFFGRL